MVVALDKGMSITNYVHVKQWDVTSHNAVTSTTL